MEKMTKTKIKDIVSLLSDGIHGTPIYSDDDKYYFINGNNLQNGKISLKDAKKVSEEEYLKYKNELNDRTILVSINGSLGKIAYYNDEPIILGKSACYFNLKNDIYKDFIKYVLIDKRFQRYIHTVANGSTIKNVSLKQMNEFEFDLPDFTRQKKIGDTLSKLDKQIEINDKINSELEAMARTMYDYWFVQFDFPDKNGRPYKSNGGEMVFNKTLNREIPKNWIVKQVKDLLNVKTGKEDANFATDNGNFAFFTCGEEILKCDTPAFYGKSVLIAGNGNFNVKYYDKKFNAYQRTYVLTPEDPKYVGIMYKSAIDTISKFTSGSNGSIVKFITKNDVESINILVPDNVSILSIFNEILDLIQRKKDESDKLSEIRDFLLPMLMNGQILVTDN